jgi:hypothetical protein
VEIRKRFSIRHGVEAQPNEPVFEDAPMRLRFFVLETLQTSITYHRASMIVGRALCKPELGTFVSPYPIQVWQKLGPYIYQGDWWEVYNLIEAIWKELEPAHRRNFAEDLNRVFSEESIGWKLDEAGCLQRTLPATVQAQVEEVFRELQIPRFASALTLVKSAHKAYNARPRTDRDVCTNIFDALESVAKEVFGQPNATFGHVLKKANGVFAAETISTLEKLYGMANAHFRHGMTEPFKLKSGETDFVYLTCLAGMLLFVRSNP